MAGEEEGDDDDEDGMIIVNGLVSSKYAACLCGDGMERGLL